MKNKQIIPDSARGLEFAGFRAVQIWTIARRGILHQYFRRVIVQRWAAMMPRTFQAHGRVGYIWAMSFMALSSCSPIRSSAYDEKHLWELTLHEVQTNLDDLRHDVSCFKTELQILDGRTKYSENAIAICKQELAQVDKLSGQLAAIEKRWSGIEKNQKIEEIQKLLAHANETTLALTQFKNRIQELEGELLARGPKISSKTYTVKSGDSLEKIARIHGTSVDKMKKLNRLENDRIMPGQEITLPNE